MKKTITFLYCCALLSCSFAQPHHANTPPIHPQHFSIDLSAENEELFTIYVDGDLINKMPQKHVFIANLSANRHEVFVVLHKPFDKITSFIVKPEQGMANYLVSWNRFTKKIDILNIPTSHPQTTPPAMPQTCSNHELEQIKHTLEEVTLSSDRLHVAKGILSQHLFTTKQILYLAQCFSFDSDKLTFFKEAYTHCINPKDYHACVKNLTFSSSQKELQNFILQNP